MPLVTTVDTSHLAGSHPAAHAIREYMRRNALDAEAWVFSRTTIAPDQCLAVASFSHAALTGNGDDELVVRASRGDEMSRWEITHSITRA